MLYDIAQGCDERKEYAREELLLRESLKEKPDYRDARYFLAECLARQGRFKESLAELDRLIAAAPANTAYQKAREFVLGQMKEAKP